MRIVMVTLEYWPITGGAQHQIAALAPRMIAAGAEIHVITRRKAGLVAEANVDGVHVHRLPAPGPKAIASLVFTACALFRLIRLRPDLLHVYSLFSPSTIGWLARRLLVVPVIAKVLRGGEGGDVERLRNKPLAGLRIAALRNGIDRFVSISSEIAGEIEGLGVDPRRCVAIPNGVDIERFRPPDAEHRRALRARFDLAEGPVVLYVGRLVPEKRVERLIDAARSVRDRGTEATLVIAGTGACEDELRTLAGSWVRFMGDVDDVAPLLRAADLFVLPSATEGLSNALLEAMATGLPVVATRVGGAVDVVEDGKSGRLVGVDDAAELESALVELLDPTAEIRRAALGRAGRRTMIERNSLDFVARRLLQLYAELGQGELHEGGVASIPKTQVEESVNR